MKRLARSLHVPPMLQIEQGVGRAAGGLFGHVGRLLGLEDAGITYAKRGMVLTGDPARLRAETTDYMEEAIRGCVGSGLRVRLVDDGANRVTDTELDAVAGSCTVARARLASDFDGVEVTIEVVGPRHVRQVMRLGGHCIEVLDATPDALVRTRRPMPAIGSPLLQGLLGEHGLVLPLAPTPTVVPAPLRSRIEEAIGIGRVLVWRPSGNSFAFGLFQPAEMIGPMRGYITGSVTPVEGAPPIVAGPWPFFRWGSLHLMHIGWAPDYISYYLDQEGCVWSYDTTQNALDLNAGSLVSFLERFVNDLGDAGPRDSCLIFFPRRVSNELPAALGASHVARQSAPRATKWTSDTYTVLESAPTIGEPIVEIVARTNDDLPAVLRWARDHWATQKVALTWMPAPPVVERAARDLHIEIVDGGPSSWKAPSFWK